MRFLNETAVVEKSNKFAWQLPHSSAVSGAMALQREHVCKMSLRGSFYILLPDCSSLQRFDFSKWTRVFTKVDPVIFSISPSGKVVQVS